MDIIGFLAGNLLGGGGFVLILIAIILLILYITKQGPFGKWDIGVTAILRREGGNQILYDKAKRVELEGVPIYELKNQKLKIQAADYKAVAFDAKGNAHLLLYMPNRGIAWPVYVNTSEKELVCPICHQFKEEHYRLLEKEEQLIKSGTKKYADGKLKGEEIPEHLETIKSHEEHKKAVLKTAGVGILTTDYDPDNLGWNAATRSQVHNFWQSPFLQYLPYIGFAVLIIVFSIISWQNAEAMKIAGGQIAAAIKETPIQNLEMARIMERIQPTLNAFLRSQNVTVTATTITPP